MDSRGLTAGKVSHRLYDNEADLVVLVLQGDVKMTGCPYNET